MFYTHQHYLICKLTNLTTSALIYFSRFWITTSHILPNHLKLTTSKNCVLFVVFVLIYSYFLCRKFGKLLLNDKEGILMRLFAKKCLCSCYTISHQTCLWRWQPVKSWKVILTTMSHQVYDMVLSIKGVRCYRQYFKRQGSKIISRNTEWF